MISINEVRLLGRVGKDPDVRYAKDGSAVATLSVATSKRWVDRETGEKKESTEWHRVTAFGKLAEMVGRYVSQGKEVYVTGDLTTRKWTDKYGVDRYTTEVRAREVQFGRDASRDHGGSESGHGGRPAGFDDLEDDIPF